MVIEKTKYPVEDIALSGLHQMQTIYQLYQGTTGLILVSRCGFYRKPEFTQPINPIWESYYRGNATNEFPPVMWRDATAGIDKKVLGVPETVQVEYWNLLKDLRLIVGEDDTLYDWLDIDHWIMYGGQGFPVGGGVSTSFYLIKYDTRHPNYVPGAKLIEAAYSTDGGESWSTVPGGAEIYDVGGNYKINTIREGRYPAPPDTPDPASTESSSFGVTEGPSSVPYGDTGAYLGDGLTYSHPGPGSQVLNLGHNNIHLQASHFKNTLDDPLPHIDLGTIQTSSLASAKLLEHSEALHAGLGLAFSRVYVMRMGFGLMLPGNPFDVPPYSYECVWYDFVYIGRGIYWNGYYTLGGYPVPYFSNISDIENAQGVRLLLPPRRVRDTSNNLLNGTVDVPVGLPTVYSNAIVLGNYFYGMGKTDAAAQGGTVKDDVFIYEELNGSSLPYTISLRYVLNPLLHSLVPYMETEEFLTELEDEWLKISGGRGRGLWQGYDFDPGYPTFSGSPPRNAAFYDEYRYDGGYYENVNGCYDVMFSIHAEFSTTAPVAVGHKVYGSPTQGAITYRNAGIHLAGYSLGPDPLEFQHASRAPLTVPHYSYVPLLTINQNTVIAAKATKTYDSPSQTFSYVYNFAITTDRGESWTDYPVIPPDGLNPNPRDLMIEGLYGHDLYYMGGTHILALAVRAETPFKVVGGGGNLAWWLSRDLGATWTELGIPAFGYSLVAIGGYDTFYTMVGTAGPAPSISGTYKASDQFTVNVDSVLISEVTSLSAPDFPDWTPDPANVTIQEGTGTIIFAKEDVLPADPTVQEVWIDITFSQYPVGGGDYSRQIYKNVIDLQDATVTSTPLSNILTYSIDSSFQILAENQAGTVDPRYPNEFVPLEPLVFVTETLPNGNVGIAYTGGLSANGGLIPYTFSFVSGTLPPGLALLPNGTFGGNPTTAGGYVFTAKVSDKQYPAAETSRVFSITIDP